MILRLAIFVFLCLPLLAQAQIGAVFGTGPVSQSMGGTSLLQGMPSGFQTYSAPAALGFIRQVEVSAGAQYMDPKLKPFGNVVLNSNGTRGDFQTAGVRSGGGNVLAIALPFGKVRPLTLGAAFYLPFGTLVRVSGSPVNYPFYPIYSDIARNFFFVLGAGYELFDGFALGLNMRSTTKSTAVYALRADSSINYSASAVEAKGESRLSVSILYDFEKKNANRPYTLGAMYRARAGLETKLAADVSAFFPLQGSLTSTPAFTPDEWVLMGTGRVSEALTISSDVAWAKWSKYSSPYGTGNINSYVIGTSRKDALFRDVLVPRVGFQYAKALSGDIKRLNWRLGYLFHPSPVPDQSGDSNFVDNDRHMFSSGVGLGFQNPWAATDIIDLDFFFQYNWLKTRVVTKNTATTIGAPGYRTGGSILLYGMGIKLRF